MSNALDYKGYIGSIEFSEADGLFFGKVQGIRPLLSYEGTNAQELLHDFHAVVDDYLALSEAEGTTPERAYKGSFNVRVSPELHKESVCYAMAHHTTLNNVVETALRQFILGAKAQ